MNKKIAIAIDGTRNSKEALDYAVVLNQLISDLTFTLLHIQASISLYLVEEAERDFKARQTLEKVNQSQPGIRYENHRTDPRSSH